MPKEKISVDQLCPGIYIDLSLQWDKHPFFFSKFRLKTQKEIQIIHGLQLGEVWYWPEKSTAAPLPLRPAETAIAVVNEADQAADQAAVQQQWQEKKALKENLRARRREIQRVERQYNEVVGHVKDLVSTMNTSPVQAMNEATTVVDSIVATLQADQEALVHLMNANNLDDTAYYHVLNVSVLSLLLAREIGIVDREQMSALGLAALLHDIGLVKLPRGLVRKTTALTKPEAELYARHVRHAVDMVSQHSELAPNIKRLVLAAIEQHHVMLDGSGYPNHIKVEQMSSLGRILAMVNYYDKLCNHADPKQSLTPHEALSLMFSKQRAKFDAKIIQVMVKLLGIYPPGTLVQLSDESIGIVISLNRRQLLKPSILLYSPDVPKAEAVIIELGQYEDLQIAKSLRPTQLSKDEFEYLNPRERVTYFFALTEATQKDG